MKRELKKDYLNQSNNMLLAFLSKFYFNFCALTLSIWFFGKPNVPIATIGSVGFNVDIVNALITAVTSIVLALIPLITMVIKKKFKIKDSE